MLGLSHARNQTSFALGSTGSVTRRPIGTCLPHLDTSGKARLSKYMGQYRVVGVNKRDFVAYVVAGMTRLRTI